MTIWFDMDGTIANLYAVDGWLSYLIAEDPKPYQIASVMVNMNTLARLLNKIQRNGNKIGIISWTAKNGSNEYNQTVAEAKKQWLAKHLNSVQFDYIKIVPYGLNKNNFVTSDDDILFDDEENNRNSWSGKAYDVQNILEILKKIA